MYLSLLIYCLKEQLDQTKEELKNTKESFDKTFEQMEEWKRVAKFELEIKELRAELAHQKLLNAHMALQTKMEEYQKQQQQTIDDLTEKLSVSVEQLSLKHQGELEKLSNAHKKLMEEMKEQREKDVAELEKQKQSNEKVVKLEKYQKEQQLNIVDLQEAVATLRELGWISVIAEEPLPENPYFEVKILVEPE
uniref:Growth arrest-specific protein 8 n=1 Tax=Globodera pallida TaxID=36090 RepID=A0A183BW43_GLOPA